MSNGTSDGEEHSTQDSDSQASGSSSKQAALTRALELLPTAQAVKDQEEETLNVSFFVVCFLLFFFYQGESADLSLTFINEGSACDVPGRVSSIFGQFFILC